MQDNNCKHPDIEVRLSGENGNALFLVGIVRRAMGKRGVSLKEQLEFCDEALSGDYDHVLATCRRYVSVN